MRLERRLPRRSPAWRTQAGINRGDRDDLLPREKTPTVQFFYVYLLRSESSSEHYYVGFTEDPAQRLNEHNDGKLPKTARFRPWHTKSAHAFREKVGHWHLKSI